VNGSAPAIFLVAGLACREQTTDGLELQDRQCYNRAVFLAQVRETARHGGARGASVSVCQITHIRLFFKGVRQL